MKIVLLAGGSGKRLWPLSRDQLPKQFLRLGGKQSLLRRTVERNLALVPPEDILILTHREYLHEVLKELPEIPKENILLEPTRRNTAPALALALKYFQHQKCPSDELVLVVPSDHVITPVEKYSASVQAAVGMAHAGKFVVFGVHPHRPETGYGYIQAAEGVVQRFVEKPILAKAQEYLLEGNYYWNAGMFLFTLATLERELSLYAPEIYKHFSSNDLDAFLASFATLPEISIDYAVCEKSTSVAMMPLELSWSDVGSWENIYELLEKDGEGNVTSGKVEMLETKNSLIFSEKRLVSTLGLENLLVVETEDAVLVADKNYGQRVKELVEKLQKAGRKEVQEHLTTHRPWGSYTILGEQERYKIKKIEVKPLEKLSLQLHYHRSEHWVVVKGTARVTIGTTETLVHEGESIFVPKTAIHRVENPGKVPLEIIEVQVGEYLGEDDIIRLEDVYGRLPAP